jgi:hypothetical protein
MPSARPASRATDDRHGVRIPADLPLPAPGLVAGRFTAKDIPQPVYAAVGALTALRRADLPRRALHTAATVPTDAVRLPVVVMDGLVGGARALTEMAGGAAALVAGCSADLRQAATGYYRGLSQEGRDTVVAYAAERAVRTRVSRVEDSLAPRAGRAAVRIMEHRRRIEESPRAQRAAARAQRTRSAVRRGVDRFAELNRPVLADDTSGGQPSA